MNFNKIVKDVLFKIGNRLIEAAGEGFEEPAPIRRVPVVSSAVVSVGYRAVDRVLEIEFQGGRVYQYAGVRPWEYERLMDSPSIGRYVNAKIKPFYEGIPVEK